MGTRTPPPGYGNASRLDGPLSGIRICDLSGQLAGAGATRMLAAFGAQAIRIEDPVTFGLWDIVRQMGPYLHDDRSHEGGSGFNNHNVEKLGITIDLRKEKGKELLREIVRVSDAVTENFAAGVLERPGFGYGPHRRRGHGIALLAALWHRRRTGEGQWVDPSCSEAVIAMKGPTLLDATVNGRQLRRPGEPNSNRGELPLMVRHGIFRCSEEASWVVVACRHDHDWQALGGAVVEVWADPALTLDAGDAQHDEIEGHLLAGGEALQGERGRCAARFGVRSAPVARPAERCEKDADSKAWGEATHTKHGSVRPVRRGTRGETRGRDQARRRQGLRAGAQRERRVEVDGAARPVNGRCAVAPGPVLGQGLASRVDDPQGPTRPRPRRTAARTAVWCTARRWGFCAAAGSLGDDHW